MITVEKKLNIFSKLVYEKVKNEADTKLHEMQDRNEERIKVHKEILGEKAQEIIDKKLRIAQRESNKIVSDAHMDIKKKIMKKKKALMDRLISEIRLLAEEFTQSNQYKDYFLNTITTLLSSFSTNEKVVLFLTQRDINKYKDVINVFLHEEGFSLELIELKPISNDIIGGALCMDKKEAVRIDASLKTKIEENRNVIGQILHEDIRKAGDWHE